MENNIENNELPKKDNKKKILIISIIAGIIMLFGSAYAFFTYSKTSQAFSITSHGIRATFAAGSSEVSLLGAYPISDEYAINNLNKLTYIDFTVSGDVTSTDESVAYEIYLREDLENTLDNQYIRLYLTDNNNNPIVGPISYSSLTNTTFVNDDGNGKVIYTDRKKTTFSHQYRLYVWLARNYNQNEVQETFSFNVVLYAYNGGLVTTISDILKNPTIDTGIKFYKISGPTNGEGLYMMESTENDPYPIYYYRGNVTDNNVYFAESCWKIVRTTSTGGLKLIYNGSPTIVGDEKQCLETTGTGTQLSVGKKAFNSSNSPAYVGYSLPESSKRYSSSSQIVNATTYYGSSVDPTTYKLVDPVLGLNDTHHYSYDSTDPDATGISGDTGSVRYYYYVNQNYRRGYFIKFDKTKDISTIFNEMLTASNSKDNPSTIQGVINDWWGTGGENSLNSKYGRYLEDTEWCNDRSVASYGGWTPDGTLSSYLRFNENVRYNPYYGSDANNIRNTNTPILTCSNLNDRLSVANGNLTYPIGLLTYDEVTMAGSIFGGGAETYLLSSQDYWLLSPIGFDENGFCVVGVASNAGLQGKDLMNTAGVRPSLSLKVGTEILGGDGSKEHPYIVTE